MYPFGFWRNYKTNQGNPGKEMDGITVAESHIEAGVLSALILENHIHR